MFIKICYTDSTMRSIWNNLGLGESKEEIIFASKGCDYVDFVCSKRVLEMLETSFAKENNIPREKVKTEFINHGNDMMVYVLKTPNDIQTVLMGLPTLEFGKLKKEADLLHHFHQIDKSVISPTRYQALEVGRFKREFMLTPYVHQARCISNLEGKFGLYVPEPIYRFVPTDATQTSMIKTCIVAKLISSFDLQNNMGISKIQITGGDFILQKGWEKQKPTLENTMDALKLISARDSISCSLEDYVDLIKQEFPLITKHPDNYKPNNRFILNTCSEIPFSSQEIEKGVELGLKAQKKQKNKQMTF